MAVLLCRCCGARLEIKQGASIVKCGYCGVQQTVPILGFDEEALLWDRAEELRRSGEYDRAMSLYAHYALMSLMFTGLRFYADMVLNTSRKQNLTAVFQPSTEYSTPR